MARGGGGYTQVEREPEVREARTADRDELAALRREHWLRVMQSVPRTPAFDHWMSDHLDGRHVDEWLRSAVHSVLVQTNQWREVTGMCVMRYRAGRAEIVELCMSSGEGDGRQLAQTAVRMARALGGSELHARSISPGHDDTALWRSLGMVYESRAFTDPEAGVAIDHWLLAL
jgi:hypothetical protein